jgi:hypothetical protein
MYEKGYQPEKQHRFSVINKKDIGNQIKQYCYEKKRVSLIGSVPIKNHQHN